MQTNEELKLLKKKEELAEKNSKVDVIILDSAGAVAASNLSILKGMCGRESMEIKEMVQFINTPKEARFDKSDPVDKESPAPDVYGLLLLGSSKEDKNIQEHDGVGAGMPLCLYTSLSTYKLLEMVEVQKTSEIATTYPGCLNFLVCKIKQGNVYNIKDKSRDLKKIPRGYDCIIKKWKNSVIVEKAQRLLPSFRAVVKVEVNMEYTIPRYWSCKPDDAVQTSKTHFAQQFIRKFIIQSMVHGDSVGRCGGAIGVDTITKVERIENYPLWCRYRAKQNELRLKHKKIKLSPLKVNPPVPECCTLPEDVPDSSLNEFYLFHGTKLNLVEAIINGGLDERDSKNGLYGNGIYFASQACKSVHYSDGVLLIYRVTLGDIWYTDGSRHDSNKPPQKNKVDFYDSLVATGVKNRHDEYIVYDKAQTYPAYVAYYSSK
eukprot:GHVL01029920.1.p1 GENE.GHVL01029920.1~~GHVL01029920.1.p1  ORF type:complete len:432 (+),score=60.08 GHVL01029920.1:1193-2488(+)